MCFFAGGRMVHLTSIFKLTCLWILSFIIALQAQESLQESLQEETDFYNNFGVTGYSKKEIEQQKIPYYDNFGVHIVNGYLIYGLENERNKYYDSDKQTKFLDPETKSAVDDTTVGAYNNMFQTSLVSENFNNLIIAKDGLGDMKSVFLIGSQIQTRLSPLTMNKLNFQGIRWDIWTPSLKFTTLLSRTRPFFMSQNDVSGRSYISYDRSDMNNWQGVKQGELLPDEEYIRQNWASGTGDFTARRDGWVLQYDQWSDFSNKSVYGDYDILLGLHGKTNIANVVDVGVTYLNHHRSDIKKGEKIFTGDVPDDYIPEEIHFEIYDLTPDKTDDLGARLQDIKMKINGQDISPYGEATFYQPMDSRILAGATKQLEITGTRPLIATFNVPKAATASGIGGMKNVKSLDFNFTVSGNYIVFVSTDKMVSYGFSAQRNPTGNEVAIDGPFTRKVEDLTTPFTPVKDWTYDGKNPSLGGPHNADNLDYKEYGNSWFGDYIAKSPRVLFAATENEKNAMYATTARSYEYSYSINVSSVTYGLDFKGKALGVKFNGEIALNKKEYKFPGGDRLDPIYRLASYVRFDRDIVPNRLALSGMFYNIAPEYDPALEIPQVSQYFSYSMLYTRYNSTYNYNLPDYLYYPQHFNNNFHLLDCNKDNDLYVESDRPVYPSDLGSGNAANRWFADGTFSSYKASNRDDRNLNRKANYTRMPNNLYTFYGDDDGVYVDRYDRNHNGVPDYKEDFLLYYTDPPIFSIDNDANNNDIWDVEDANPYPDMPNGVDVSYVLTSNGWKSQGIRGVNAKLVYTPVKNLEISSSVVYDKALRLDFNPRAVSLDNTSLFGNGTIGYDGGKKLDEELQDSKYLGVKGSARLDVVKRNMGLEYFMGGEVQYLQDNIRNDAIRSKGVTEIEYLYTDYYYQTDELRYRNAALSNIIAGVAYNNIPNFLYNSKISFGLVKRMELPGEFYTVRTLRDESKDTTFYQFNWEPYPSSMQKRLFLVNKFDYTIKFKLDIKGWASVFNILNRLTINPQYKFSWSYTNSDAVEDPRATLAPSQTLSDEDSTRIRLEWARYKKENENVFTSSPILRLFYKIAESTQLQYGIEWKRDYDRLIKAESNGRTVQTLQVYSTDNVSGYNIALIMGMNLIDNDYDVLNYNPLLETGKKFDGTDTRFFIKVYAGN